MSRYSSAWACRAGKEQRVAIARALLKQPKVLIFDEATSALDGPTAEAFAQTINRLKGKVTMLFITHALPKALVVDRVWVLTGKGVREMQLPQTPNSPQDPRADSEPH